MDNGELKIDNARLPKGWEIKKLGEVCTIKPPKKLAKKQLSIEELVTFFPMANLKEFNHYINPAQTKRLRDVYSGYVYFENNDVLLAKITPCFENGKLGIAKNLENGIGFGSSEYMVLRPDVNISSEYIYYFLSLEFIRQEGKTRMTGAVGHKRIPVEYISNQKLIVPPLPEQKRIVKILDQAFVAIGKAKENADKNLQNAKELFESYLNGIFANPGKDWEECKLSDYVEFIDYRGRTPKKTETGIRLITAKNIKKGYLQREPEEFIAPDNYDSWMTRGIPQKGDVLFTTEAPLANVAQLDTNEKVAFAQRTIIFQPKKEILTQTFLKYLLLSIPIQNKIIEKGTGATVKGIKSSLLKKIPIDLPDIPEQKRVVLKLDQLQAETKRLEKIYQQKIADTEELKKSILQKAFEGEL